VKRVQEAILSSLLLEDTDVNEDDYVPAKNITKSFPPVRR
jgi:hypothetical protein